jgi:hypothetical protein
MELAVLAQAQLELAQAIMASLPVGPLSVGLLLTA